MTRMGVRAALAAMLLLAVIAGGAVAGPLEDGRAAYDRGDFKTALRLLRSLAEKGVASAQFHLGLMYYLGQGVPQDYAEAVKWYRRAAEQGVVSAQNNLGAMYANGHGVPQDYAEAVKWYRLAAEQGDADAQLKLGLAYHNGFGVPQDYVAAHKWFNLAASKSSGSKALVGGDAAKYRDEVASSMTSKQIAEAQRLAREWKAKPER